MSHSIYHFTHISNLKSITTDGLICKAKMNARSFKDISSQSVQDKRSTKRVPIVPPNGNLHDYVPFYFGTLSPTLYTISKNSSEHGNTKQNELIYLVSNINTITQNRHDFVFTDGHGIMAVTEYYNDINDIKYVDFDVVNAKYWYDTASDPDRKRRRQAEFLIHDECSWQAINTVGVFDEEMKNIVEKIIQNESHKPKIEIKKNWYY